MPKTKEAIFKVEIEISKRFIADQCEGAYLSYWSDDQKWEVITTDGKDELMLCTRVHEPVTKVWTTCDWERAIKLAIVKYPHLLDESRMDRNTGDTWVQLAAFGEVRYG